MGPALLTRLFIIQGDMVAGTDGQMETGIVPPPPTHTLILSYPITSLAT
jgi:hypothetical protein